MTESLGLILATKLKRLMSVYVAEPYSDPSISAYGSQVYLAYLGTPPGYLENMLGSPLLMCLSSKAAHVPGQEAT